MSQRGRLVALVADAANRFTNGATQYGGLSTRICAASTLLKLFDIKRLDELTAGAIPTAADAEKLYDAFAPCRSLNVLIQAFQSAVVGLTIDQSRCINAEGPTLADSKPFVIAALRQTTAPVVSDAIKIKLNNAATKCLTASQRTAMGIPS